FLAYPSEVARRSRRVGEARAEPASRRFRDAHRSPSALRARRFRRHPRGRRGARARRAVGEEIALDSDEDAMPEADVKRTIDAVWRIESARLIAGIARIVRD